MKAANNKESLFRQLFVTRTSGLIDISEKRHFWQELANELSGMFIIEHTVSKDLESLFLHLPYKHYRIEFTESDTHPLKITCKLEVNHPFEFNISYEDSIEKLLKLFGQQDVQVGDEAFDHRYLIQGSDDELIADLFGKSEIKSILLSCNVFSFNCVNDKRDHAIQLSSLVSRTIDSKSALAALFKLFCLTIEKMELLGIIK